MNIAIAHMNSLQYSQRRQKAPSMGCQNVAPLLQNDEVLEVHSLTQKLCQNCKFKKIHNKLNVIYPEVLRTAPPSLLP